MAWGRMDDGFDDHPKVLAVLDEDETPMAGLALGLWTLCWTWAHRNTRKRGKTPGLIPPHLPRRYFGVYGKVGAEILVRHGLWDDAGPDGWMVHDFEDYLPTEETREARSEAGKRGAAKRWAGHLKSGETTAEADMDDGNLPPSCHTGDGNAVANDGSRAPARRDPIPTPIPTPVTELPSEALFDAPDAKPADPPGKKTAKRTPQHPHRIPDDFAVRPDMVAWAAKKTPLVDWPSETERFVDHWIAAVKNDFKRNWDAAWRTWMRNTQDRLVERGVTRPWTARAPDASQPPGTSIAVRNHQPRQSTAGARYQAGMDLAAQLDAEMAAKGGPR